MNKKLTIAIIILILLVTAFVFSAMWQKKNAKDDTSAGSGTANVSQQQAAPANVTTDADVEAVESDLNSVSDDDFSADNLSDVNLGL